ncbi:hypothetical protein C8R45DRAFT_545852 [Mycena sanguinolenta]|nr:hypothetical protein C8R45DRAFT_545852 [Mycena sanguinolenta]
MFQKLAPIVFLLLVGTQGAVSVAVGPVPTPPRTYLRPVSGSLLSIPKPRSPCDGCNVPCGVRARAGSEVGDPINGGGRERG